jgi:OmpA-OmpF porin, OOP family
MTSTRPLLLGLLVAAPTIAHADGSVEAGLSLGGHVFSSNTELGTADDPNQPVPKSSVLVGGRLGVFFSSRFGIEAEAVVIPTKSDPGSDRATVVGFRGQLHLNLLTGSLRPFLVAGYGGLALRTSDPKAQNDSDPAAHWGLGLSLRLTSLIDLRIEGRHLIVPNRSASGATSDFEGSAGISLRFGDAPKTSAPPPPPPPTVVEGPPRPLLKPKRGDTDGDGVEDSQDQCPGQPEDRDGFQDDDGCADPDNDGDGIVDAADQCPDQPETKNGHDDDDGCPDQAATDLVGFTFPRNSDKFDPAAAALLERTYQVLERNTKLNVEIAGHTSEGESKPLELSIGRAEAVKEYLVRRGISEDRLRTVGYGNDRPVATNTTREGRDKNRRIEFRVVRADE